MVPMFSGRSSRNTVRCGVRLGDLDVPEDVGGCVTVAVGDRGFDSVVVVSLGERDACSPEFIRRAGGAMAGKIASAKASHATVDTADVLAGCPDVGIHCLCEGVELGGFRFDRHKTDAERIPECRVSLVVKRRSAAAAKQVRLSQVIASSTNYARAMAHEPANVITPVTMAARARALAKSTGLKCTIIDHKQMVKLRMGAMLAVGQGSDSPPRLIVLEYGSGRRGKPVVLVGKAITFDTGGYSIKDKNSIVGMKYDKCGGTAVLGAMRAVASIKPKVPVVGVIAAAENMISGGAYRPNDIITAMSGKTIEIISTDAEGRLVLADALTYAQKKYKPRALIDLATLTGGVVVALGRAMGGIFANDDDLRDRLMASGERTFERLWPLPIDDDYLESIKGDDCDIKNSGGREGHASIAAVFLKQFVDPKVPWAHLDIAGVADVDKNMPYCRKGATGFGVRLLCDYLGAL